MKYRNTEVKNDSLGCIMDEFSIQKKEFRYIYVKKIIKEPNRVLKLMGECYGIKITPHRLYGVEFTIELEKNIDLEYVIECKESEFLNEFYLRSESQKRDLRHYIIHSDEDILEVLTDGDLLFEKYKEGWGNE
ncbi:MAG: hypothetical protein KBF12_13250 [Sebaldella sp.]|nr:hypothetical protein [Sebaldella sp.]